MLLSIAERFRDALVPFLVIGTGLVLLLLALLVVQRLVRAAIQARRRELEQRYYPIINAVLAGGGRPLPALPQALRTRHRAIASGLLLSTLRVIRGPQAERARAIAEELQLTMQWRRDLKARRWWLRAEATLALGLVGDRRSVRDVILLLDDDAEQVRAAAIDALGQIGDDIAIPALLNRLRTPTRHERARVIQALRGFGDRASGLLLEYGRDHPGYRALVATVLAHVGASGAAATLLEWSATEQAETRAAVWTALAAIGLDDRAFYHAVKALDAPEPPVRAAAARALARSGRDDATPYLAARLDDEWEVAAQSARALARLGAPGQAALAARAAGGPGLGQELARQLLWEGGHR